MKRCENLRGRVTARHSGVYIERVPFIIRQFWSELCLASAVTGIALLCDSCMFTKFMNKHKGAKHFRSLRKHSVKMAFFFFQTI